MVVRAGDGGRPLRFLFHHRIASRDGQSVHMDELAAALRADGHEVILVGPQRLGEERFGGELTLVAHLKRVLPRALYEILELGYNLRAFTRLRAAFLRHRPDVLYERYNLFTLAGVWVHRLYRLPMLLEVNAPLAEERERHGSLALARLAASSERTAWRGADLVLPVTGVLADHVRRAGVPDPRIVVIPNGVDEGRFSRAPTTAEAKRCLGLEERFVLGFTGFFRDWHRLDRVIDLLAERRDDPIRLHLLVVGDGDQRSRHRLQAHADERGVADRLTMTGTIGRDTVVAYVSAFDIALQPGVTSYASPLKLFEYMMLERAIVAPDSENIREILTDGEDALLFDPAAGAFKHAVMRLVDDPDLRTRLGRNARRTISRRRLTWASNADRIAGLARSLLRDGESNAVGASRGGSLREAR